MSSLRVNERRGRAGYLATLSMRRQTAGLEEQDALGGGAFDDSQGGRPGA